MRLIYFTQAPVIRKKGAADLSLFDLLKFGSYYETHLIYFSKRVS